MKNKKLFILTSVFMLVSCNSTKPNVTLDDYRNTLSFASDTFNIMQLTDVHWTYTTDLKKSMAYMQDLFDDAKKEKGHIDLLMVTGDLFLNANKYIVETLFDFFSSWNVPVAVNYGNHDKQGEWNTSWMNKMVSTSKNFITKTVDDDLQGNTNYFIDIKDGDEKLWQIYVLDSNSYMGKNMLRYQYDYIHENQTNWMKNVAESSKVDGEYLPSLGFIHIPTLELKEAVKDESATILGELHEGNATAKVYSPFFDTAKEINMKGFFFGHDHSNDLVTQYKDVVMGYGVKSNIELYYYKDETGFTRTGYATYSLKKDKSWSMQHVLMDYNDHTNIQRSIVWESK